MSVAVVILNWNGKNLLQSFLPDLVRYSKEAKVYLIDNASEDDSISYVGEKFPEIKTLYYFFILKTLKITSTIITTITIDINSN